VFVSLSVSQLSLPCIMSYRLPHFASVLKKLPNEPGVLLSDDVECVILSKQQPTVRDFGFRFLTALRIEVLSALRHTFQSPFLGREIE